MTVINIGALASKIYDLISDLEKEETVKVFKAVFALSEISDFNSSGSDQSNPQTPITTPNNSSNNNTNNASAFFAMKAPKSKMEILAVAARFREAQGKSEHTKKDFEEILSQARFNFDSKNFTADMKNAKAAGYFVKDGKQSHSHKLSYAGQNFVDALPDRNSASAALKKKVSSKARSKKAAKKIKK